MVLENLDENCRQDFVRFVVCSKKIPRFIGSCIGLVGARVSEKDDACVRS